MIASFWYGSDLSWLEALCITSYLDHGHRFVLYTAHDVAGIPEGVEQRDAADVLWPPSFDLSDNDRLRVAVFSDIFRFTLIQKTGFTWVDLDAYCVRPFDFDTPHVFGHGPRGDILSGVLALPPQSAALRDLRAFVASPNPTPPWRGRQLRRKNRHRISAGETWGIESLAWGCSGPKALTHFLRQSGEDQFAQPVEAFYGLAPEELWKLHDPSIAREEIEHDGVFSVHIYGHQKKLIATTMGGLPAPGSYLDRLCQRHAVDPLANRIPTLAWMR
ncbi:hypothetical protein [Yoonia sp.]|uniref:hypothetical protein n=1 Tax=Yoonia sp. TaxID=2212373 RepID=UPI003F4ABD20